MTPTKHTITGLDAYNLLAMLPANPQMPPRPGQPQRQDQVGGIRKTVLTAFPGLGTRGALSAELLSKSAEISLTEAERQILGSLFFNYLATATPEQVTSFKSIIETFGLVEIMNARMAILK